MRPHVLTICFRRGCAARPRCVRRLARRPRGAIARSNPVPAAGRALEYLVYGRFRFEEIEAEDVDRLGTEWVPVSGMARDADWGEKEDEFDDRVREARKPFT